MKHPRPSFNLKSHSRPTWAISDSDQYVDEYRAQVIEDLTHSPAYRFKSAHRHNGMPMVPPSALEYQERWESAHGDNVPILTAEEIATLRRIR